MQLLRRCSDSVRYASREVRNVAPLLWRSSVGGEIVPSAGRRAVVASKRVVKTATLTEANVHVREVAARSVSGGREWEFFCECGVPVCNEEVTLPSQPYTHIQ